MSATVSPYAISERLTRRASNNLNKLKIILKMDSWSPSRGKKQKQEASRCYLMELPTELLLEILSHLTLIPEAALALTCKRMFAISGAILSSKSLRFTRDFAPLFHHYRDGHNFATPRWQFIRLLENSRWSACSKCLKLHPRSAFSSRELKHKTADDRTCNVGELAGIVDLCPCKKLTFQDKLNLADDLRVRKISLDALKSDFGNIANQRYCWHSCTEQYGPTKLTISLYPELNEEDQVIIRTEYQLTTESGQIGKEDFMTPRFGCAHRSVDLWVSSAYQTTICQLYDSCCSSCKRIRSCGACDTTMKCPRKQPFSSGISGRSTYSFWTQRCLGGIGPEPDATWAAQRIHPAEKTIGVDNCNELCPWTVREHPPLTFTPNISESILSPAINEQALNSLYSSIRML